MSEIAYCKIYPPVGIARVGDSEENDGWFYGPEFPGRLPQEQKGFSFRDSSGRIKRQAARFRLYAFDSNGKPIRELTDADAEISWTVSLANKKAAWFEFQGTTNALAVYRGKPDVPRIRNVDVGAMKLDRHKGGHRYSPDAVRKAALEIDGGTRTIKGAGKRTVDGDPSEQYGFVGSFKKQVAVELGEARTDEHGRLVVLGGRGKSDAIDADGNSIRGLRWIRNYANNDDWYDDTSDGPITASVVLRDTKTKVKVRGGAWVLVAPPDFAPDVTNLVTLYDVMEEVALNHGHLVKADTPQPRRPDSVYFDDDIEPILNRIHNYRWVNAMGLRGHGFGKPGDFQQPGQLGKLSPDLSDLSSPAGNQLRQRIFSFIRKPAYQRGPSENSQYSSPEAISQATALYMPPLAGDEGDPSPGTPESWLSLSHLQYDRLDAWRQGNFQAGPDPSLSTEPSSSDALLREIRTLTRTVMEAATGGAFYPGIEMTSIAREPSLYSEAFRFTHDGMSAGDVTKYMALPWQADFWECQVHWWPAQRPDDVVTDEDFDLLFKQFTEEISGDFRQQFDRVLFNRTRWDRGVGRRARPNADYLSSRLLPDPEKDTAAEYIDFLTARSVAETDPGLARFLRHDSLTNLVVDITPIGQFEDLADSTWPEGKSGERLPSPWRLQYTAQESLDAYSGLYFHPSVPSPDDVFRSLRPKTGKSSKALSNREIPHVEGLRERWGLLRLENPAMAARFLGLYAKAAAESLVAQVRLCLSEHPAAHKSGADLQAALSNASVGDLELANPHDFKPSSPTFKELRAAQLIEQMTDRLYVVAQTWSGDMDMVDDWRKHGFVVKQNREVGEGQQRSRIVAQIEQDRVKYDGRSFRDYFYYLMNIEEFQDFIPYAKRLAQDFLNSAQLLINKTGIMDSNHPESFVDYSRESLAAKLEEIYETLRQQAATALGWRTNRTRAEWIRDILDTAPFNQTDGAWLRYVANAGPSDRVRGLLFEVWSDEVGNGNPALHHGNLFTTLLNSLGKNMPPVTSRAYADYVDLDEGAYIGAVFQLAISLHSESFFPELLGMTLFLEWEVLTTVPGIEGKDYIGIDSQFWRMHVGIDNASEGHGAMARAAVEMYLDQVAKEGGEEATQAEWKRIWRGFVAFSVAGYDYFQNKEGMDDLTLMRKHPSTPEDEVKALMQRKAHYGSLNHINKRLGGNRMNDLFDDPDTFVDLLAASPWVKPGQPDESQLLTYLTTFAGPMYQVFDASDLKLWRRWIEWLGREGDTEVPKRYISKARAMLIVLSELRELAKGSDGHRRYRLAESEQSSPGKAEPRLLIADFFEKGDLKSLMRALANPDNGWVVPFDPGASPLIVDQARGTRPMGAALDRRFPSVGGLIGREVVVRWIEAGCPIPGEVAAARNVANVQPKWDGKQMFVQQIGMGAVH